MDDMNKKTNKAGKVLVIVFMIIMILDIHCMMTI